MKKIFLIVVIAIEEGAGSSKFGNTDGKFNVGSVFKILLFHLKVRVQSR